MSEVIVRMEMPKACITKGGYYGNCPMDRVWCIQRNAPSEMVMKDACADMTESIPSWCPIVGVLPDEHGDLIDRDAYLKLLESFIESKRGVCENKEFIVALQAISKQIKCVKAVISAERKDDGK